MTALFSEKEKNEAYATRRRLRRRWTLCFMAYLAIAITLITINIVMISTSRSRAVYIPFMITMMILSVIFWSWTVFFRSIEYRLTKCYCIMLEDMEYGGLEKGEGVYLETDAEVKLKDGVYFYSLILDCPPLKRSDVTTRKLLVERTHALPKLDRGDKIKFVAHANRLVAYELVKNADSEAEEGPDRSEAIKGEQKE